MVRVVFMVSSSVASGPADAAGEAADLAGAQGLGRREVLGGVDGSHQRDPNRRLRRRILRVWVIGFSLAAVDWCDGPRCRWRVPGSPL